MNEISPIKHVTLTEAAARRIAQLATAEGNPGLMLRLAVSGGGCSDVPYLASEMIGKTLKDAPSPRQIGYTLCAYTLAFAFEEARRLSKTA